MADGGSSAGRKQQLPFLGHLYSEYDGLFHGSCLRSSLEAIDAEITPNSLHLDMTFEGEIDEAAISHIGISHVIVGVKLEMDVLNKGMGDEKERLNVSLAWLQARDEAEMVGISKENEQLFEVTIQMSSVPVGTLLTERKYYRNQNLTYSLITVEKFIEISSSVQQNVKRVQLLKTLEVWSAEIDHFVNLMERIQFCVPQTVQMDVEAIKLSHISTQTSHLLLFSILTDFKRNFTLTTCNAVKLLARRIRELKAAKDVIHCISERFKAKVEFIMTMSEGGCRYVGCGQSLDDELLNNGTNYFILQVSHLFMRKENVETVKCFLELPEDEEFADKPVVLILYDVDVAFTKNLIMKRVNKMSIFHYYSNQFLSYDVLQDRRRNSFILHPPPISIFNLPKNSTLLKMSCPGSLSGLCPPQKRFWMCCKCQTYVEYGFDDMIYCTCGTYKLNSCHFQCYHLSHEYHLPPSDISMCLNHLKPVKAINLLLLGPSGVGKSTWINSIVNYVTYGSLRDARNKEFLMAVPTKFTVYEAGKTQEIVIGSNTNENVSTGDSATQNCKCYSVVTQDITVRIIDTPGMGDTRGYEQDVVNMKNTLSYLNDFKYINGVCLLLKPNLSRFEVSFTYCIKEILSYLPRKLLQNILFCFTNARSTFYKPGDSLPLLQTILNELNCNVTLKSNRLYCLDNESYRFLCSVKYGSTEYSESDVETFEDSWERSVDETKRMFRYVTRLSHYKTEEVSCVLNLRSSITFLCKKSSDIMSTISSKRESLKRNRMRRKELFTQIGELRKLLYTEQISGLRRKGRSGTRVVCTHTYCVNFYTFKNRRTIEYKTTCCNSCDVETVLNSRPCADLIRCSSSMNGDLRCSQCGCRWEKHMLINYDQYFVYSKVKNDHIDSEYQSKLTQKNQLAASIKELEEEVKLMFAEKYRISDLIVQLGHYLKNQAIAPFNSSLIDYLSYLIQYESDESNKDLTKLRMLKSLKNQHEEEAKLLEKAINSVRKENLESLDALLDQVSFLRP